MHALFVNYRLRHAAPAEHAELRLQLAPALAAVAGLVSKTWLENRSSGSYGGFYVFESKAAFDRFVASELFEMTYRQPTVADLKTCDFAIDHASTALTRGPTETRRPPVDEAAPDVEPAANAAFRDQEPWIRWQS